MPIQAVAHAQWQSDYFQRAPHMPYIAAIAEEAEASSTPPYELFFGFLATLLMEEQEVHAKRGVARFGRCVAVTALCMHACMHRIPVCMPMAGSSQ